jgi:hypothetical protein
VLFFQGNYWDYPFGKKKLKGQYLGWRG